MRYTKDFEAKYNKVKAKLALLSSSASSPKSSSGKNKGLIAETYKWDEEELSSNENEAIEVKALMALANEERVSVSKESASNGEWVKISVQKVHTLLEMEDNDDRTSFLDYLCIDLNYVEEQRNNLLSKHRNLVQELNTCKEQLLILNQAKLDLLTMQHVNTEILKENQKLRNELKELTSITETWLNSSNKVNQWVSITGSNKPKLSEVEDSTLSNHDTGKHPLPPLEKLVGAKPVPRPKTIESNLKSNHIFKAETLKAPTSKKKNMKVEDDPPLAIIMKELNELKLQLSKKKENNHLSENCFRVLFCKKCKRTDHRTCDHAEFMSSLKTSQHHTSQGESSLRSRPSRPM
ncbi:hypothetical protein Tco_1225688 [Tanacetum coccineum]